MIFRDESQKYWDVGLPAIPLISKEKRPAINAWQRFADAAPTQQEKDVWVRNYPDGNIGLPMGAASGLIALDIDTDDQKIIRLLEGLLPKSPWSRVGKKGMVWIYRFSGERTTRVKTRDNQMLFELLSKGTQIVLPPSIHPDTQLPYQANVPLYEVFRTAPALPVGMIDILRASLSDLGMDIAQGGDRITITNFIPSGARDSTMVSHAGILSRAVTRGERTLLEALSEMSHWVETYTEHVIGDPLTVEKAQMKVVEFLVRDVTGERRMGLPAGWDEGLTDELKETLGLSFTEDDEKWTLEKLMAYLQEAFERFSEPDSEGRRQAINVVMDRLARSEGELSLVDEDRVLRFIVAQSAATVSLSVLKRQLALLRKGDIGGENHNEIAIAVLEHVSRFGELRFDSGKFWQWKGAAWVAHSEDELIRVIASEFGFYPACRRQTDYQSIVKLLRSTSQKALCQINFRGLNFANGFLTEAGEMMDHNSDFGCTYVLPYRYAPELADKMPLFNQFLYESWGDDPDYSEKVAALQEVMGSTMFGTATRYQRAVCLYGQPGSGKSRASAIMRGLLPPESISNIPPQDWNDKFLPAEMFGKLLNMAGELSESKAIPGETFKRIIEGEDIPAQYKNMTPFSFAPRCAHWFNSNHLPKTRDTSDGFNRRWLFLEWTKRVPVERRILDLDLLIMESEREAIAAWAVEGFQRLRNNSEYTLPSSHMALSDQMAVDNNSVRYFLASSPLIRVGKDATGGLLRTEITATKLYDEYWSFSLATGVAQRVSSQSFQKMMRELSPVFDFKILVRQTSAGGLETVYQYITTVN